MEVSSDEILHHQQEMVSRLVGMESTLSRVVLELANLTTKVGQQNGRVSKLEEQNIEFRIKEATEIGERKGEALISKRIIWLAGIFFTGITVTIDILVKVYIK